MDEKIRQLKTPSDISSYSFRDRLVIRAVAYAYFLLISVVGRTFRIEHVGIEKIENIRTRVFAVWHEFIFAGTFMMSGQNVLVMSSKSRDGDYMSRALIRLGYCVTRGSSSRGGTRALIAMIEAVRLGLSALITVDGPKGPAHVVKPGVCVIAQKTGNPIIPLSFQTFSYRRAGSWDRLRIPRPFSRVVAFYGDPIIIEKGDDIEEKRDELQCALEELDRFGEVWLENNAK